MGDKVERLQTVVIGGGQAGLAAGYHLKRQGVPFVILDAHERVGDAWRTRWDSLRLFTPASFDGLPGWRYPARSNTFPTKDDLADYLESYARRFDLPARTGVLVDRLSKVGDRFVLEAGDRRFEADHVVVATGAHHVPKVPAFASQLDPGIVQLHSKEYRNPSQLRPGPVLLVGLGNSGAEIAFEVARTHPTLVAAGRNHGQIPVRHGTRRAYVGFRVMRFVFHHVLTMRTPMGRRAARREERAPLIRVRRKELRSAGVEIVGRVADVCDGRPVLDDGRVMEVANVIWCTGFRHDFPWIDLPIFDEHGRPRHRRGVAVADPDLAFAGLVFQFASSSDVLPGIGRDAAYVAKHLAKRVASRVSAPRPDLRVAA